MKMKNLSIISLAISNSLIAFQINAGEMGLAATCPSTGCTPYFVEVGAGFSFSQPTHVSVDLGIWNPSPQGYNNSMQNAALYMAGIGYTVNPWFNFDFSATYRGAYKYSQFQSHDPTDVANPLPARTRFFDVSSNAVMFNGTIDVQSLSDHLAWTTNGKGFIQPFIGAGIGASYNTVSNFHTILTASQNATSVMSDNTKASLAYQFNAGLEWVYQRFSLDAGYRYFNGGNYKSNDFLATRVDGITGEPLHTIAIPAWSGTFSANEVFLTAKIAF